MAFRSFVQRYVATKGVKRWFFNRMGYNQYGLYHDDLYYETPEVKEAVRRLPQEIQDARVYRMQRAFQLSISQSVLPKEEWTKFEDDLNYRYLQKYIDEVKSEKKEKDMWAKLH